MKTVSCFLLLMASLAFVLMGCSDSPDPVAASADAQHNVSASLLKTSGPGAWIVFGEYDTYRVGALDPNSGLALMLGVNDWDTFCLPEHVEGMDPFPFRDILLPGAEPDLRRILEKVKSGDITAYVWDLDLFEGTFCGTRLLHAPIAMGTVRFSNNDNDLLAFMQTNPNRNAFGYKANGTIYGAGDRAYNLNFVYRFIWDPNGVFYNETFKVQLTPTGK